MKENVKRYLETASQDAEHLEKLKAARTAEQVVALAKEKGHDLSVEDLKADDERAVNDDELNAVAGGEACACGIYGLGKAGPVDLECQCAIGGGGQYRTNTGEAVRCICAVAGGGVSFD